MSQGSLLSLGTLSEQLLSPACGPDAASPLIPLNRRRLGDLLGMDTHLLVLIPAAFLEPDQEQMTEDSQYGRVHVRAWHHLHAIPQNHPGRGTRSPRPVMRGTLILVEVARLLKHTRVPKQWWLWWHAPEQPLLPLVWRAYVARFLLEHTFRFVKQVLNWTLPRVRHPEQADRWTWLVVLASTRLRLARPLVADHRLRMAKSLWPRDS